MSNDLEDRELMEGFKNGDIKSFELLFKRHSQFIKKYINQFVRNIDTAEEIMQEVFIVLYKSPEKYNGNSKVINYIIAIARNRTLTYLRDKKTRADKFKLNAKELYGDKTSASALSIVERKEDREEVNKVLDNMNLTYKTAIILIDYHELSYKQAAEIMGKSVVQIKAIIHRARKKFEEDMMKKFPHTVEKYSKKKYTTLQIFLAVIIGMSMISGLVYATIKLYEHYQEKREAFQLKEKEETIDESQVGISKEHAKEIIDLYLQTLGCSDYNLEDIVLEKDLKIDSTEWILKNNNFEICVDSYTGNLVKYNSFLEIDNVNTKNINKEEAKKNISDLYNKLKLESSYELYSEEEQNFYNFTVYKLIYAKKYGDLYNPYESIVIEYVPDIDLVHAIRTYDFAYIDEEVKILKDDIIQIINEKKLGKIKEIELEIMDINSLRDNYHYDDIKYNDVLEREYNLNNMLQLRKVWKVGLEDEKIIYIDSITGDILKEDMYTVQEKKY